MAYEITEEDRSNFRQQGEERHKAIVNMMAIALLIYALWMTLMTGDPSLLLCAFAFTMSLFFAVKCVHRWWASWPPSERTIRRRSIAFFKVNALECRKLIEGKDWAAAEELSVGLKSIAKTIGIEELVAEADEIHSLLSDSKGRDI